MTRLSQPTEFQPGSKTRRVERLVGRARAVLAWERFWPALWPATGIAGLFLAAALFGLFALIPWTLHALILAGVITAIGVLLYVNLSGLFWPNWHDGARRLERDSRLQHRPISEANDSIAAGAGDDWAEALWRAHLLRRFAEAKRLRVTLPSSALAAKDPRALRFIVLLLLIGGFVFAGRQSFERIGAAFTSEGTGPGATIDAWIDPPAYTGEAPIYLSRAGANAVPTGSVLNMRVHGASHLPGLSLGFGFAHFDGANGEYATAVKITADTSVRVRSSGRTLGDWSFTATPDHPPSIAFAAAPGKTEHDALKLSYIARDDYGVVAARAIIVPHGRHGAAPLVIDLPLAALSAKSVSETSYFDLTENPYAGLDVDITLVASDAIGQTGRSRTMRFTLPARVFTDPLARALIEQRTNLAAGDQVARDRVLQTLDALAIAPDRFYPDNPGLFMGLRAAYWGLKTAHHEEEIAHVEDLLWQMATSIERGGLLAAAEQLRQVEQALLQALASGAPQNVIDALMQRYEEALQRYVQSLAANGPQNDQPLPQGAKVLTEKDIDAMLKAIEQMAQSGDRAGALQMMALLQSLLENLHSVAGTGQGQGEMSPGDKALSDAIQGLSSLIGKQRGLMDKTYRQGQGAGDPKDGGPNGLANQQGQLHDQLNKILKGLGDQKQAVPKDFGDAGQDMGQSQQSLGNTDMQGAGDAQKQALDALQKGTQALAKQLAEDNQQGTGGAEDDNDPLGRASGAQGSVKLPNQSDLARARGILQELRKRAGELGRPKEELDYIDRLLKQF